MRIPFHFSFSLSEFEGSRFHMTPLLNLLSGLLLPQYHWESVRTLTERILLAVAIPTLHYLKLSTKARTSLFGSWK